MQVCRRDDATMEVTCRLIPRSFGATHRTQSVNSRGTFIRWSMVLFAVANVVATIVQT